MYVMSILFSLSIAVFALVKVSPDEAIMYGENWIPVMDTTQVRRSENWMERRFRNSETNCLATYEDGAELNIEFKGTGLILCLGGNSVPAYGSPNLGKLLVTIDDENSQIIYPQVAPREIVLARGLKAEEHCVRMVHHTANGAGGCMIAGFRILEDFSGDLGFFVNGEDSAFMVDVRAILKRGDLEIRNTLVRNWLTGQCRLTGLPPGDGYTLELRASGWETRRIQDIAIKAGSEMTLPPIYLYRGPETRINGIVFPALGHPVIRRPGQSFRTRFQAYDLDIGTVKLRRSVGPATISRIQTFKEDPSAAFYYDREGTVTIPEDMPEGLYDLMVEISSSEYTSICRSPSSVYVVRSYPKNPVFITFGHLDTWGQYQAEYIRRLAEMANLFSPDMVLVSNAVNPAYISGALSKLQMPYIITFGNHQFFGHEKWYGEPVDLIDFGPDLCILNFGHPWHVNLSKADALLSSRAGARCKIINAFEHNAPVESFLDKHRIQMIHDGHGPGKKVMEIGATPTQRIGKQFGNSFRIVRFQDNKVLSCTYQNDEVAPISFDPQADSPLRVAYVPANDGTQTTVTAVVTNTLEELYPNCRLSFVLPRGTYAADRGLVETSIVSDDGKYTVMTVRCDLPSADTLSITVSPRE